LLEIDFHRKQQSIWMQDFPIKSSSSGQPPSELAKDFVDTLADYLTRCGLKAEFLHKFDYSKVKVVLISSVPGFHKGNVARYGHMKVRHWLSRENLAPRAPNTTEALLMQCSSIGSLHAKWLLQEFLQSLGAGKSTGLRPLPPGQLVWPSVEYVRNCIDGYTAGGSLCCNAKNMKDFMIPLLRRYQPLIAARERIPPHIKTYYRYSTDGKLSWAMTTSANLSTGAWGQVQQNGQQIMIRNFEIGVLFLPSLVSSALAVPNIEFFGSNLPSIDLAASPPRVSYPLPCHFPPAKYGSNEKYWVWDIQYGQPDVYGLKWPPDGLS
jgi:tyrosyl-DNA phosphodiesterase 1